MIGGTRIRLRLVHSQAPRLLRDRPQRKAWDLNPHDCHVALFSKQARLTVFGYLPLTRVDSSGIEPELLACRASVFPLDHEPASVERRGIEPRFPGCRPGVVPLDQHPVTSEAYLGIEPNLRPYQGRVLPEHLKAGVGDMGVEPNLSGL